MKVHVNSFKTDLMCSYILSLELFLCVPNLLVILKKSPDSCFTFCSVPEEEENDKEEEVIRRLVWNGSR